MIEQNLRYEIRELRSKGMTYHEICDAVGQEIPKGTLSYICKNVILPPEYFVRYKSILRTNAELARTKAVIKNATIQKKRFKLIEQRAVYVINSQDKIDSDKRCLATLYIAEGSKYKSYRGLALGSSDPDILRLYIGLLMRCYDKKITEFRVRIQHRDDQNSADLQNYWSHQLNLPLKSFYLSYADKRSIGKPTLKSNYMGVCVISCSGADIQLELDAIARLYAQKIWGISAVG